ncbi:hypothetical protein CHUAL_013697 [Chamberlinius hualienensis]
MNTAVLIITAFVIGVCGAFAAEDVQFWPKPVTAQEILASKVCGCQNVTEAPKTSCKIDVNCDDYKSIKLWLDKRNITTELSMCDSKSHKMSPFSMFSDVYQLINHNLLQSIVALMKMWRRNHGLFLVDNSSGIEITKAQQFLKLNKIDAQFVFVFDWTLIYLENVYHASDNIIIICNEDMTERILEKTNQLYMFNTTYTWVVCGQKRPRIFTNINFLPQISMTFFKFPTNERQQMELLELPADFNCSNNETHLKQVSLHLNTNQQLAILRKRASQIHIYDVFYGYYRNKVEMVEFGKWTIEEGLQLKEYFEEEERKLRLRGKLVRATVFEHKPYSYLIYSKNNTLTVKGYLKDIYGMIMSSLNMRYKVHEIPPGFGIGINGTYTGFVGRLYRKEGEISMNVLAYTDSRSLGVRYTGPLTRGFLAIVYNRPKPYVPPTTYWMPFELDVWILTMATLVVLFVAIGFGIITSPGSSKEPTKSKRHHTRIYRVVTGTFFEEALTNPTGLPTRIMYATLLWTALMMFNHYTSVFTSFLTLLEIKIPFTDLEDVVNTKDYRVLHVDNTRYQEMFQNAKDGLYAEVWRKILSGSDSVPDFDEGLKKFYEGEKPYVYLTEGPTTLSLAASNCSLSIASTTYVHEFFYLTVRNDFPYAKMLNMWLIKIMESGLMNRLATVYQMHKRPPCTVESSSERLGLEQTVGLYVLLSIGITLSLLILLTEFVFKRNIKQHHLIHKRKHVLVKSTTILEKKQNNKFRNL